MFHAFMEKFQRKNMYRRDSFFFLFHFIFISYKQILICIERPQCSCETLHGNFSIRRVNYNRFFRINIINSNKKLRSLLVTMEKLKKNRDEYLFNFEKYYLEENRFFNFSFLHLPFKIP